ncbi:MAG: hypothetical protein AABY13_02125 [Nanoarchaeota archaeon]
MKPMHIVVTLVFLLVLVLIVTLVINTLFPTPDPQAFAGGLGVPGA